MIPWILHETGLRSFLALCIISQNIGRKSQNIQKLYRIPSLKLS